MAEKNGKFFREKKICNISALFTKLFHSRDPFLPFSYPAAPSCSLILYPKCTHIIAVFTITVVWQHPWQNSECCASRLPMSQKVSMGDGMGTHLQTLSFLELSLACTRWESTIFITPCWISPQFSLLLWSWPQHGEQNWWGWKAQSYLARGEGPSEQMKGVRIRVFTSFKLCEHFE